MDTIAAPSVTMIPRQCLEPWPRLNPRTHFDEGELQELAESIKIDGIQEPVLVVVCPPDLHLTEPKVTALTTHLIYAGERRWRAAWIAELEELPCIVRDIDEATAHRIALVENLQRANLGPVEEARGLQRYIEVSGKTQKDVGESLGYTQAWVANRLRLLQLPAFVLDIVESRLISATAARDAFLPFVRLRDDVVRHDLLGEAVAKLRKFTGDLTDAEVVRQVFRVAHGMSRSTRVGWDYGGGKSSQVYVDSKMHASCGCGGPSLKYQGDHDEKAARCFDLTWWNAKNEEGATEARAEQKKNREGLGGGGSVPQWKPKPAKLDGFTWEDREKVIPAKTVAKRHLDDGCLLLWSAGQSRPDDLFDPAELPADKIVKIQVGDAFDLICLDPEAVERSREKAAAAVEQHIVTLRLERGHRELAAARDKELGIGYALTVLLSTEDLYFGTVEGVIGDLYPERMVPGEPLVSVLGKEAEAEDDLDIAPEGLIGMSEEQVTNVAIVLAARIQASRSGSVSHGDSTEEQAEADIFARYLLQLQEMVPGDLPKGEPEEEEEDPGEAGDGRLAVDGEAEDEPAEKWEPAGVGAGSEEED